MGNRRLSVHTEHELLLKLEGAGLDDGLAQKIIESKGNKLAKQMVKIISLEPIVDKRFKFVKEFKITVPNDYNHVTQLATFAERCKRRLNYYANDATDINFAKTTDKLVPGKTYRVKIFAVSQSIQSQDALSLIASQKGIFTGIQGASLVYQLEKEELPTSKWYISFDKKDALWVDSNGDCRISDTYLYLDGDINFNLSCFEKNINVGNYILCFCEFNEN